MRKYKFRFGLPFYADGMLKSKGSSVMVCFDFAKKQKNEVYDEFKRLFQGY